MPKALDRQRLTVTHDPNQRIDLAPPRLQKPLLNPDDVGNAVVDIIKSFTGIDLADPESWPIVGDFLEILAGVEDGQPNDLGSWLNSLLSIFRPVPAVSGGAIADEHPNLLIAPDFRAAGTIKVGQNWEWTNEAGFGSIGCAKVTAAGYLSELMSNEIPVTGDQTLLRLSVKVKWAGPPAPEWPRTFPMTFGGGLIYTGTNPIALGVTRFMDRTEVGSEDLVFVTAPSDSSDWVELVVPLYEVPDDCDEIRLRLKVGENLTEGTVWFDDASVTTVGMGIFDHIVRGLENVNQPGWDLVDLLLTMLNQFQTTTDHAARITYLEGLQSSGNKINDEFLRTGSTLGADWAQTYTGGGAGSWSTDGDFAFWTPSGFGDREVICRYIGTPSTTATDSQKIIAVTGAKGGDSLFARHTYVDLYGRMDAGLTNWIRARFSSDGTVRLERCLSGVVTTLGTIGKDPVSAGSTIALVCGTPDGDRYFQAIINGSTVLESSDATSNFGASYRGYGHGVRAEGSLLILGQLTPPSLNAWAAKDNDF